MIGEAHPGQLASLLTAIEANDNKYQVRNNLVFQAVAIALALGYKAGVKEDLEPHWPVMFIELPVGGQVSWHIEAHKMPYDGHTTVQKYHRCRQFIEAWNNPHKWIDQGAEL